MEHLDYYEQSINLKIIDDKIQYIDPHNKFVLYKSAHILSYESLIEDIPWVHPVVKMYERTIKMRRGIYFMGNAKRYKYGRLTFPSGQWSICPNIKQIANTHDIEMNHCLIEHYPTGEDNMEYRKVDSQRCLLLMGHERTFKLWNRKTGVQYSIILRSGDLLKFTEDNISNWMIGMCQNKRIDTGTICVTYLV